MVRVLTKDELNLDPHMLERIKNSIFIYPTDTIYGIGCDATNKFLVDKIRAIKKRKDQPFSVIIPNKECIYDNFQPHPELKEWMKRLPGPYTLILSLKKQFLPKNVNPLDQTLGVRIPNHWFSEIVRKLGVPIVTTSVNLSGDDFMTSLDDLNSEIKKQVDFIIYDGPLKGKPSNVIHLEKETVKIVKR